MIPKPTWAGVLLALTLVWGHGRTANADVPDVLPGGYVMEADSRVRWVYPESAAEEVAELKQALPDALSMLEGVFGAKDARRLDVRLALQAGDLEQLAPKHQVPGYATGVAYPQESLILMAFAEPLTFGRPDMRRLFVHELSHVLLSRAVDGKALPRWFSEGVAVQLADEHSLGRVRVLWEAAMRRQLQPLDTLSKGFPSDHHEVSIAYAQSADLVGHMLDGADERRRFRSLLSELRTGQPFERAVQNAYGVSLGYLEREWRSALLRRFGRWPSLLSGLTLVWTLTAVLLLVGYIRVRRRHHHTLARWSAEEETRPPTAAQNTPPPPPTFSIAVTESVPKVHRLDELMDRFQQRSSADTDIPTVEHDGRSHTLH